MFWFYLGIVLVFDLAGVSLAKKYALTQEWPLLAVAMACFALVIFFLSKMFQYENFSIGNAIWYGTAMIVVPLIGVFYFGDKLSILQWIGIAAILFGILLIQWPTK